MRRSSRSRRCKGSAERRLAEKRDTSVCARFFWSRRTHSGSGRGSPARVVAVGVAMAVAPASAPAFAGGGPEPTYGRVDGDVSLVVGIGGVLAARAPRAEGELRVRYLESAGLFATYEDGPVFGSGSEPSRVIAAGLELRPVFLYRWLRGLETRRARFDLTLDSLGLEFATTLSQALAASSPSSPGMQIGLGIEVPVQAAATGPWVGIHGGIRWGADALAYGEVRDAVDRAAYLAVTIGWHQMIITHIVDVGDEAPQ
jgi:hypothetical protein